MLACLIQTHYAYSRFHFTDCFAGAEVLHTTDYHMNPLPAHQVMSGGPPPDVVPGHANRPKNRLHDAVKYGSREASR